MCNKLVRQHPIDTCQKLNTTQTLQQLHCIIKSAKSGINCSGPLLRICQWRGHHQEKGTQLGGGERCNIVNKLIVVLLPWRTGGPRARSETKSNWCQ